jgi:hypothetical protein
MPDRIPRDHEQPMSSNLAITAIAWVGLGVHVLVAILARRSALGRLLVPAVNFIVAACVVLYWAQRWFGYLFRGITWSASDQWMPVYAILVCVLAGGTLAARWSAMSLNWLAFTVHGIVFVGAVLFVTFFRMKLF